MDALLSGKLKALERVYDELKLLKRGCKIVDKAPLRSATSVRTASLQTLATRSRGVPCGEHGVPGLPQDVSKIPNSFGCEACAEKIKKSLGGGKLVTIKPTEELLLPKYRGEDSGWYHHVVVVYNGRVYDAWTGRVGETIAFGFDASRVACFAVDERAS